MESALRNGDLEEFEGLMQIRGSLLEAVAEHDATDAVPAETLTELREQDARIAALLDETLERLGLALDKVSSLARAARRYQGPSDARRSLLHRGVKG